MLASDWGSGLIVSRLLHGCVSFVLGLFCYAGVGTNFGFAFYLLHARTQLIVSVVIDDQAIIACFRLPPLVHVKIDVK